MMAAESKLEKKCRHWAHIKFGVGAIKLGTEGLPDRMFLRTGKVIFVEFKAEGKKARPLQKVVHKQLELLGFTIHIIDDFNAFKILICQWIRGIQ
jgi:hypothetical protein